MKTVINKKFRLLRREKNSYNDMLTEDGENLSGIPWQEYPRPQLKRDSYINLNGVWGFAITKESEIPEVFPMEIQVPFSPESILSGVHKIPQKHRYMYYKKSFQIPSEFIKDKVILHFGAVDQIATIYMNGTKLMEHVGGYLPFSVDITSHIQLENILVVKVKDNLDHRLPYGKQKRKRGGMWYTPVSGIWQTVWMESVSQDYIKDVKIKPTLDEVTIMVDSIATKKEIRIYTVDGLIQQEFVDSVITISIPKAIHWTPENPYLYQFELLTECDKVVSYFALRTLTIEKVEGIKRLCLNGKPYFFHGLLDQGYYSDGIYLPASINGFTKDIHAMKKLGFNTLRKHIKIEPAWYYYLCDTIGMVVFQDMVNNGHYSFLRDTALPTIGFSNLNDAFLFREPSVKENFKREVKETIEYLYNFPSICYWTIFNEGWGQFDSDKMYRLVKEWDDSRFVDSTSGWFQQKESDVLSKHIYFVPISINRDGRPVVISEFGGYSYKIPLHSYNLNNTYGYRFFSNQKEFQAALTDLYLDEVASQIPNGLCAAIYTQVSDVEDETNGLFTYDRRVLKVNQEEMLEIAERLKIES